MAEQISASRADRKPHTEELWLDEENDKLGSAGEDDDPAKTHELDSPAMLKLNRQLQSWYYEEREKQSVNRYQMAIDHDFYDSIQWSDEDAEEVESRGQAAIVYNETAPMVDWVCGTERRTRMDWKVLPRTPDDVAGADVKTKVLKFVSDINKVPYARSRAFDDAVKVGIGWLEDGARNDPTEDILFSRYESWRNVLWDSCSMEMDLRDCRYLYRWRWVDLDMAIAMFPERKAQLRKAAVHHQMDGTDDDDFYYMGQHFQSSDRNGQVFSRRTYTGDPFMVGSRRRRVKLIEAWYKVPTKCEMCSGAPFDGKAFDETHPGMKMAKEQGTIETIDAMMMRMHYAVMTEKDLIAQGKSPYRHNRFPFTPIWGFRRGRDGMVYGLIRRVRDIQEDLNKRASKAQFVMSTNQLWGEEGAVDDWDEARAEADRPDGVVIRKKGKELDARRDSEMGKAHMEMFVMDATKIQHTSGVTNENLGRQSNSGMSGEAIKSLQVQGSVQTITFLDNHRYAMQCQGEKQLANVEQFYSEPKVIRLTEAKGQIGWLKINDPEIQPDGSVRWLNDITASQADFVVSEQDYHGTLRQAMFESMMNLAAKLPPDMALRLLRMAFEFSDMPNKDEIVAEIRRVTGEPDPSKKMSPEEMAQIEAQRAAQQAMFAQQQAQAAALIAEQQAKAKKINAEADKIIAEVVAMGDAGTEDVRKQIEEAVRLVQIEGATQVERVTKQMVHLQSQLAQAQVNLANRTLEINKDADTKIEVARIEADSKKHVAEVAKKADEGMAPLLKRVEDLGQAVKDLTKKHGDESVARDKSDRERDAREKKDRDDRAAKEKDAGNAAPAETKGVTVVFEQGAIQVGTGGGTGKTVTATTPSGKKMEIRIEPDQPKDRKPKKD